MSTGRRTLGMTFLMGAALALGGCASVLNGVGGSERYACRAPVGAQCTSVSGTYANGGAPNGRVIQVPDHVLGPITGPTMLAPAQNNPGATHPSQAPDNRLSPASITPVATVPAEPTLRTAPRVLQMWVAPWEDSDGDLHEATRVHVLIDQGRWRIERLRPTHSSSPIHSSSAQASPLPTMVPMVPPTRWVRLPSRHAMPVNPAAPGPASASAQPKDQGFIDEPDPGE